MERIKKHAALGVRWLKCGWRLFKRNPWLLCGMGACSAATLLGLSLIPLIGDPFIGLLAPSMLASFYLAIDGIAKQKAKLPRGLRMVALRHSPKEFLNVSHEESRLLQVVVLGFYGIVVVVLADIVAWLLAGTAWANRSLDIQTGLMPSVILAGMALLAIYLVLAASLVYSLPLALLQNEPLAPAMIGSLKRCGNYAFALAVILGLFAVPLLLNALGGFYARGFGYLLGFVAATVLVPVGACSLYCSYRTVFAATEGKQAVPLDIRRAKHVG